MVPLLRAVVEPVSQTSIENHLSAAHLLGLVHDRPQPKRTGQNQIRIVKLRKVLDCLSRKLEPQPEHVIIVPTEQGLEILGLVLPALVLGSGEHV